MSAGIIVNVFQVWPKERGPILQKGQESVSLCEDFKPKSRRSNQSFAQNTTVDLFPYIFTLDIYQQSYILDYIEEAEANLGKTLETQMVF